MNILCMYSLYELTIKILMLRQSMLIMYPDLISFNSPHDLLSFNSVVLNLDDKTKPQVILLPKKRQNSFDRASLRDFRFRCLGRVLIFAIIKLMH